MEFIQCKLCGLHFEKITTSHLKSKHGGIPRRRYEEMFPEAPTITVELHRKIQRGCTGPGWYTSERRKRVSEVSHEIGSTSEARERNREAQLRHHASLTPGQREEWSRLRSGWHHSTEERERMREAQQGICSRLSPEEIGKRVQPMLDALRTTKRQSNPNMTEAQLWKFLDQGFPGMFVPDWIDRIDVGGRHPDFRTLNGYKLVIESNGGYWHEDWGEKEQIAHYKEYGYDCIVVWANDPGDITSGWPGLYRDIRSRLPGLASTR